MESIATRRRARGWSQAQLAQIVRVSKRTIGRAEHGQLLAAAPIMQLIELALADETAKPPARKQGQPRGFAVMDPEQQRALASAGGKTAHKMGRAHEFTRKEARKAGRKGGLVLAQNKEHMRQIARLGGLRRGENLRQKQKLTQPIEGASI